MLDAAGDEFNILISSDPNSTALPKFTWWRESDTELNIYFKDGLTGGTHYTNTAPLRIIVLVHKDGTAITFNAEISTEYGVIANWAAIPLAPVDAATYGPEMKVAFAKPVINATKGEVKEIG